MRVFAGPIEQVPWPSLAGCDAFLVSTDNLKAETETGQIARWLGVPMVLLYLLGVGVAYLFGGSRRRRTVKSSDEQTS